MEEIFTRRSIRKFQEKPVEPEKIDRMLRAAMQAPSAADQQPWEFIVVQEKEALRRLSQVSPYSKPVEGSAVTFILLADENVLKVPSAWEQDMSAAVQNILLEAVHLGLGGVWLGVSTSGDIVKNVRDLYALPGTVRPFALIAAGYPTDQTNTFVDRYKPERVHYEKWQ